MYICPECKGKNKTEELIQKHFLSCWKERHPNVKSKPAPRSEDITTREVSNEVLDFFGSFQKE